MVGSFKILRSPSLVFGTGSLHLLPQHLLSSDKIVLVITGKNSLQLNPVVEQVIAGIQKAHIEKIHGEPSPEIIDHIVTAYRHNQPRTVIAIGGGSVLDAGKAVSAMLPVGDSVSDYLEGVGTKIHSGEKIRLIAVPTTAGTGSEATSNAVISVIGPSGYKRSLRHENFVPDIALLDPLLTMTCPRDTTAASGMDAFTQLLESYLSVKANTYTDMLALEGISNIHQYLVKAVNDPDDQEARSGMLYASFLSGITLSNAGLGLVHGFASSIGGYFNMPHGVVCGTLMAAVNSHTIKLLPEKNENNETVYKYVRLGRMLSGKPNLDTNGCLHFVSEYIEVLTERLQIKRLGEYGIREADLKKIADTSDHKAHPVKFEKEELVEILKERL